MTEQISLGRFLINRLVASFLVIVSLTSSGLAQIPAPPKRFSVVYTPRTFTRVHSVYEFVFREPRGPSPFDQIGLHRVTLGPVAAAHPPTVMLYLPGTNMNGEVAIDDPRYSLPLYMASNAVDFWAMDYRTHFVPASTPPTELMELRGWTNEMFEADISAAVRFILTVTEHKQLFLAGFSRGAFFAYLYAAAHPEIVRGLIIFDGAIAQPHRGSPPPGVYAEGVGGKRLTWDKRQALMHLVIDNPAGPAPLPQFKSAADNLNHVVYESASFGGKGGLANPVAGFANPSVLARVLIQYDRYWPNVQDYEDSFTPLIAASLANSTIPILAFSSTNIAPEWPQQVAKAAGSTGSRDVAVKILPNWGHLDVICGTQAEPQVFERTLAWLKQHTQAASESGK